MNLSTLNKEGPHFRFKQQTQFGFECAEKTIKHFWRIPRLPNLQITVLQKFAPFFAPSCCAIREQQLHPRQGLSQTLKQNGRRACFAQRDRVNPNPVLTSTLRVMAKALFNELAIKRLCLRPLVQLASKQGLCQAHEHAVKPKRETRNHSMRPNKTRQSMRRALEAGIWLDGSQQSQHGIFNAMQRIFGMPLKTQDQHRRGVGSANQSKTIGPIDTQTIHV